VPKRAGDTPLLEFTPSYTSDRQFGGHVDIGRRFGSDNQFGARLNLVYRDGDTPTERTSEERKLAALGLDYRGDVLRLSADLAYQSVESNGFLRVLQLANAAPVPTEPKSTTNWSQPWAYKD